MSSSIPLKLGGTIELYLPKKGGVDLYAGRRLGPPCHDDVVHPTRVELIALRDALNEILGRRVTERDMLVTLATMALKMNDLTGHDVIEALRELGHGNVVREARKTTKRGGRPGARRQVPT